MSNLTKFGSYCYPEIYITPDGRNKHLCYIEERHGSSVYQARRITMYDWELRFERGSTLIIDLGELEYIIGYKITPEIRIVHFDNKYRSGTRYYSFVKTKWDNISSATENWNIGVDYGLGYQQGIVSNKSSNSSFKEKVRKIFWQRYRLTGKLPL